MKTISYTALALLVVSACMAQAPCTPDPREEIINREGLDALIPPQVVGSRADRAPRPPAWITDDEMAFTFVVGTDGQPKIETIRVIAPIECAEYSYDELPEDLQRFLRRLAEPLRYFPATRSGEPVEASLLAPLRFPIFRVQVPR